MRELTKSLGKVLVIGEVLFDIFPTGKHLGGAPFNFALHLHRFGVPVHFISRIGTDPLGDAVLEFARKEAFPLTGIQLDPSHGTGVVQVHMHSKGEHEFEILSPRAWDFIEWNQDIESIIQGEVSLVYFGTLAQREPTSQKTIQELLEKLNGKAPLFLDLNLRAPFYNREVLEQSLNNCDVLKANEDEILILKKIFGWTESQELSLLAEKIISEFNIKMLCITKGMDGSELYREGDKTPMTQPGVAVDSFQDSVGAGDAFSARLAYGLLQKWEDKALLSEAALFASRICSIAGAIPDNGDFYQSRG